MVHITEALAKRASRGEEQAWMKSRFLTSAASPDGCPETALAEFAFLGRSNVGKSSLLNRLAGAKIARTSRTPGRTQLINFFEVHSGRADFVMSDLPGYGFARVPAHIQAKWAPLVEGYLEQRPPLRIALLLIDIRREIRPDDVQLAAYLAEVLPARGAWAELVITKADKLPKAKRRPKMQRLAADLEFPLDHCHVTSAEGGLGLDKLLSHLEDVAGGGEG